MHSVDLGRQICVPGSVEELCDKCFFGCVALRRVTFGESSSLMTVGVEVFCPSVLKSVVIPEAIHVSRKLKHFLFQNR